MLGSVTVLRCRGSFGPSVALVTAPLLRSGLGFEDALGLTGLYFHDLRHAGNHFAARSGAPGPDGPHGPVDSDGTGNQRGRTACRPGRGRQPGSTRPIRRGRPVTAHDAAVVDTSIIAALKLFDPRARQIRMGKLRRGATTMPTDGTGRILHDRMPSGRLLLTRSSGERRPGCGDLPVRG